MTCWIKVPAPLTWIEGCSQLIHRWFSCVWYSPSVLLNSWLSNIYSLRFKWPNTSLVVSLCYVKSLPQWLMNKRPWKYL